MATLLNLASITYPFGNYGQSETIVLEDASCSRVSFENADCSSVGLESASVSRINCESVGHNGVCIMPAMFNGQALRGVPFTQGIAGPTLQGRLATDPLTSGAKYGEPLLQSDIDSIELTASLGTADETSGQITWVEIDGYDPLSLTVSEVISDTLQPWYNDSIGYNFSWRVPAAMLSAATAGQYAKVVVTVTLETGAEIWQSYEGKILFR